jgi:hypothetical protein
MGIIELSIKTTFLEEIFSCAAIIVEKEITDLWNLFQCPKLFLTLLEDSTIQDLLKMIYGHFESL